MKKLKFAIHLLIASFFLCFVFHSTANAKSPDKVKRAKTRFVLKVESEKLSAPAIFEFYIIKDGKKTKSVQHKTPYRKEFNSCDMTFILKKIEGKSGIQYKVCRIDRQKIESGSVSSSSPNVKFILNDEFISVDNLY